MAKKDPEVARMEAERNRIETERLLGEIKQKIDRIPACVVNGSHNLAVSFKTAASRGYSLLKSRRPTLKAVRECAEELSRFR